MDLWRSAAYRERSGELRLHEPKILGGEREATIPAPLDELPLLVRAGTVLPLLPPDVDTLAAYGGGSEDIVGLRERADRIDLLAFPRGRRAARFYGDGRIVSSRTPRPLDAADPQREGAALTASKPHCRTLRRPLRPCGVLLGGKPLPAGSWDYRSRRRGPHRELPRRACEADGPRNGPGAAAVPVSGAGFRRC